MAVGDVNTLGWSAVEAWTRAAPARWNTNSYLESRQWPRVQVQQPAAERAGSTGERCRESLNLGPPGARGLPSYSTSFSSSLSSSHFSSSSSSYSSYFSSSPSSSSPLLLCLGWVASWGLGLAAAAAITLDGTTQHPDYRALGAPSTQPQPQEMQS